ncbi:hypothetical protein Nmel_000057, partial [Mimus melanotis]
RNTAASAPRTPSSVLPSGKQAVAAPRRPRHHRRSTGAVIALTNMAAPSETPLAAAALRRRRHLVCVRREGDTCWRGRGAAAPPPSGRPHPSAVTTPLPSRPRPLRRAGPGAPAIPKEEFGNPPNGLPGFSGRGAREGTAQSAPTSRGLVVGSCPARFSPSRLLPI